MVSKLRKVESILNEKTLLVAVDIGKFQNTAYCQLPDGREIPVFSFVNYGKGIRSFWNRIETLRHQSGMLEIVVGFEPTGCYGEPMVHFLKDKKRVRLYQVNPMHTKQLKELSDNSPQKSDEKDPRVIADIIRLGHVLSVVIPQGVRAGLRHLSGARQRGAERRTILSHQLAELVFRIFPEFGNIMKGVMSKSSRYLLEHYPLPEDIVQLEIEELAKLLHKVSRGRLGADRARTLYHAAQSSTGIREGAESIVLEFKSLLRHIALCDADITGFEKQLKGLLADVPESRYILSIKGIGQVIAAGLIGEIADFSGYQNGSQLQKLAGLDLYEISSGKQQGQRHISKRGRSLMRKLLYLAALSTIRKGGIMHEIYQHHLQKGMAKPKALVAIMRKLLLVIFALVRDQREFVVDYPATLN
jgi:transposase